MLFDPTLYRPLQMLIVVCWWVIAGLCSAYYIILMKKNDKSPSEDVKIRDFLSNFKTLPCYDPSCAPDNCYFYHHHQEKRRNPYSGHTFLYYPDFCSKNCQDQKCRNYHTAFEYQYHPLIYLSERCPFDFACQEPFCSRIHSHNQFQEKDFFFRFDLQTFKTQPCAIPYQHDVKICLFYHHKSDRRRIGSNYEHMICDKLSSCQLGDKCKFSHNKIEQLYHPSRYKSKFCDKYPSNLEKCDYKSFCSFAHSPSEITIELIHHLPQNRHFFVNCYKTVWCPHTSEHERNKCVYAHNIQDFRRSPNEYKYEPINCPFWKTADNVKSIEEAGCKEMMACKKCHGRKEFQYHPSNYRVKNEKYLEFPGFSMETVIHKLESRRDEANYEGEKRGEPVTPNHNLVSSGHRPKNTQIGAPFFQNQETRSVSSKTTRAMSGGTSSCIQGNNEQKHEEKREESVDSFESSRPQFSMKGSSFHEIYGADGDKELFQVFQKPGDLSEGPQKKRARSQNRKKKDFRPMYSFQLTELFEGTKILQKLAYSKIPEVKIFNFRQEDVEKMCWLSEAQKITLIEKLQRLQKQDVNYSSELYQHFKKLNKLNVLDQLRQKKVKEGKLLSLQSQEIQLLSFMQEEDKAVLPKIIKDFIDNQEFSDLNTMINKVIEMDDAFFQ